MQSTHTVADPIALASYGTNRTTDVDTNTRQLRTRKPRKEAEKAEHKQLRLKLGMCKRCAKEIAYNDKEIVKQRERLQKMIDEGKDEYEVKKMREVLREVDVDFNQKVSLTEFLIYQYRIDYSTFG